MRNSTRTRMLSATLLVMAFLLASCATDDIWSCNCERTCDGQIRVEDYWLCADQNDLESNLAWATMACGNILATECTTYSCGCRCWEGWSNCYD